MDRVSKSLFKAKALELLRRVETTGEPLVITDNGRPTAEVRRYRGDPRSALERLRGSVVEYEGPLEPAADASEWESLA